MNNFFYKVNDKEYEVIITHKHIKNNIYRFKDDKFYVSCSPTTLKRTIIKGLDKFALRLINARSGEKAYTSEYIYLFGEKYDLYPNGKISIQGYKEVYYSSIEELLKKLKPIFLDIITKRVRLYEKKMNLPSYRVTVRNMSTRYGSNSKCCKHLTFATVLMHYSLELIDSVVVHELAHIEEFNHSNKFYNVVYKYCPNYDECHKKLRKGIYR